VEGKDVFVSLPKCHCMKAYRVEELMLCILALDGVLWSASLFQLLYPA
jgi:hypothetical protein